MGVIMDLLIVVTTTMSGYVVWYLKKHVDFKADAKETYIILLRGCLYTRYKEVIEKGEINVNDLNEIEHIYYLYHKYGGNGSGTKMINEIRKLKFVED